MVYKITDPVKVKFKISEISPVINFYAQDCMKAGFSQHDLSQILKNRRPIEMRMAQILKRLCEPYGILIVNLSCSSIDLPARLNRAMAAESEATKQKAAKLIDAQANLNTASQIRQSADELSKNPISIQLQFYEVIKSLVTYNSTIIIPDSIMDHMTNV